MKEEIQRISRLVAEGKLSAEDGAELIEAFVNAEKGQASTPPPPPPPPTAGTDPFKSFFETVEKTAKETFGRVDWKEISTHIEQGAKKGYETIRTGVEDIAKGKVNFGFFGNEEKREVSLPLSITSGKRLRVENPCGDVTILGKAESGTVLAQARIRAATPEEAKNRAAEYAVIIEESDSIVVIRQPDVPGLEVDLTIRLPEASNVEIRSDSGDVLVRDLPNGVRVNSRSGDVKIRSVGGAVEASLDSGDVSLEDVESPSVALDTKSGDLLLARVKGNINARTTSGQVDLRESWGKVVALESVSGDVRVDLAEPVTGSLNVRAVSGNVTLDLPDGNDCRVSLSSLRGEVHSTILIEDEAMSKGRVTGRLGAGTGTLDVSAVSGEVRLRMRSTTAL